MRAEDYGIGKHSAMGMALLLTLIWHVSDTVLNQPPQYLFYVCYTANLVLCLGIFRCSALLLATDRLPALAVRCCHA